MADESALTDEDLDYYGSMVARGLPLPPAAAARLIGALYEARRTLLAA